MKTKKYLILGIASLILVLVLAIFARPTITQIAGLAVAETATKWNNLKDAAAGDNLTTGIGAFSIYLYDGTNFDRARGDITYGLDTDVTRVPGSTPSDAYANPTSHLGTWSLMGMFNGATWDRVRGDTTNGLWANIKASVPIATTPDYSGTQFYSVKRTNIGGASVNIAFGFTSKKIVVETAAANTDEVCIDWLGGAAVCPAADTAGDDRVGSGRTITLDEYAVTSISVIAASGTQTIYVRAWR